MSLEALEDQLRTNLAEFVSEDAIGLFCPSGLMYPVSILSELPAPLVNEIPNRPGSFRVHFEEFEREPGESIGSSLLEYEVIHVDRDSVGSIPHDFTFHIFSSKTDFPLKRIKVLNDDTDILTPDLITTTYSGKTLVLEFATCASNDLDTMTRTFRTKKEKYDEALTLRTEPGKAIYFGIIIVSPSRVFTNIELSDEIKEELCLRYRVSLYIQEFIKSTAILGATVDEDLLWNAKEAKVLLKRIKFDWEKTEKFEPFNEEMYKSFKKPPDIKYVAKALTKNLIEAHTKIGKDHFLICEHGWEPCECKEVVNRNQKNHEQCIKEIENYKIEHSTAKDPCKFRKLSSKKAVVQIPMWIPKMGVPTTTLYDTTFENGAGWKRHIGSGEGPTFKIWKQAVQALNTGLIESAVENTDLIIKEAMDATGKIEEEFKPHRTKYHRFQATLNTAEKVELAKVGVNGKKYATEPDVIEHLNERKRSFGVDHDTNDIDEFLETGLTLFDQITDEGSRHDLVKNLLQFSYSLHKPAIGEEWLERLKEFYRSSFGRFCQMVTDIGTELAISAKQHVKPDYFILKKLRHFPVYLLIKPTDYGKHIFVSFLMHLDEMETEDFIECSVFRHSHTNSEVAWTDFVSFNPSKLKNLVECESMYFNLIWFFHDMYQIPFWDKNIFKTDDVPELQEVGRMVLISMLVGLNDKARTEEIITNSRYLMMEGFVDYPRVPKPHKMLKKLPDVYRSRLQVWLAKKTFAACLKITSCGKFPSFAEGGDLKWGNLFNFFTGSRLSSVHQVINLFYLGYIKNKEEVAEKNSSSAMYGKILKYEDMLPPEFTNLGFEDPDINEIQFHEFSPSLIKLACAIAKKRLGKRGVFSEKRIEESILNILGNKDLEEIATLKASSAFNEEWYEYDSSKIKDPKKQYHRKRVVEAVRPYFTGERTKVVDILEDCLNKIENRGCMHIDIFKKPQHGGLREIYVLGIEERIVQCALESIARAICELFDSETMTHPENKPRIPLDHQRTAHKLTNGKFITVSTSDDAEKWNQGHFVSKFALLLCCFTPEYMHPFIIRACSIFMKKRIMIDPGLLQNIADNQIINSTDEYFTRMHSVFWGKTEEKWMKKNTTYIQTKSGMMQGILHYTSSVLHSVYQEFMADWSNTFLKTYINQECNGKGKTLISHMQSSDDSCVMISVSIPEEGKTCKALFYTAVCFEMKAQLGKYFGIYDSVKSTRNGTWLMEFNSEFYFHTDVFRPTLRWVVACLTISEQESLSARQEEMSSNLTNIVAGGGSFALTAACQIGQGLLHYLLLGFSVNPIFVDFMRYLLEIPDPGLGFFLVDYPFFAGLAGFGYNLWNAVSRNASLNGKYKIFLSGIVQSAEWREGLGQKPIKPVQLTMAGTLTHSTIVRWGDRQKATALIKRLDLPEDYLDQIDLSPDILYQRASNGQSLLLRMAAKMHAPGVSTSLSKGNAVVRIIASAVYIISRHCIMDTTDYLAEPGSSRLKSTLLYEITKDYEKLEKSKAMLTDGDLKILFPFLSDYSYLHEVFNQIDKIEGAFTRCVHHKVFTRIEIFESEGLMIFAPEKLIKTKWFNIQCIRASTRLINQHWNALKRTMPWIKDTALETLPNSPFAHQTQMQNFFSRLDRKRRVIGISGAPIKRSAGMSNILTAARHNFFPGFEFKIIHDLEKVEAAAGLTAAMHVCSMISYGPYMAERKKLMIESYLSNIPTLPLRTEFGLTRRNALAVVQSFCAINSEEDSGNFIQKLRDLKLGAIGGFHLASERVLDADKNFIGYKGPCTWIGQVEGTYLLINCQDTEPRNRASTEHHINYIIINNMKNLESIDRFLSLWCSMTGIGSSVASSAKPVQMAAKELESCYRFYKGRMYCSKMVIGAPVYMDVRRKYYVNADTTNQIDLEVSKGSLRLVYNITRHEAARASGRQLPARAPSRAQITGPVMRVPLVSLQFREQDSIARLEEEHIEPLRHLGQALTYFDVAWLCNKNFPIESAKNTIDGLISGTLMRRLAAREIDYTEFQDLMRRCFKHSCFNVGVAPRIRHRISMTQQLTEAPDENILNEVCDIDPNEIQQIIGDITAQLKESIPNFGEEELDPQNLAGDLMAKEVVADMQVEQSDWDEIAGAFKEATDRSKEDVLRSHLLLDGLVREWSTIRSFQIAVETLQYYFEDAEEVRRMAHLIGVTMDDMTEKADFAPRSRLLLADEPTFGEEF